MVQKCRTIPGSPTSSRTLAGLMVLGLTFILTGCAVPPTILKPPTTTVRVVSAPETTKAILENIQKAHPQMIIRALLQPEGSGTIVHMTVYRDHSVHMVVKGFQEPFHKKKIYPDCNHWFNVTRNFDPACGGGPYLGTANLVFADGMGLGLLFDLFQAGRYPFTYTKATIPDQVATHTLLKELESKANVSLSVTEQVSER